MTSAFIFLSYSRTDLQRALQLQEALQAKGHTIWIDVRGIEPTDQWRRVIYQAIDKADTFLYLLSPDALASTFCTEELIYALENKKRIIPVVVEKVSARDVSKQVADLQWIFCLEEHDFNQAVDEILTALEIDHPHRHLGAHLLALARRWENNGRKGGLLTGRDLKEAEQWLVESANKPQGATELHIRFINASQQRASIRRRITAIVSVALAALLLSLSIFSSIQAQIATEQRNIARQQTIIANQQRDLALDRLSQALASQVPTSLQHDGPDQPMLLALTALKIQDTLLARGSLWQTFEAYPRLMMILQGHTTSDSNRGLSPGVSDLVYDPATKMLLSGGLGDGDIIQWNPATGEHHSFALPRYKNVLGIFGLALSPDGRLLASSGTGGVWIWNAATGEPLNRESDNYVCYLGALSFSHDGSRLIVGWNGHLAVWETRTWGYLGDPLRTHDSCGTVLTMLCNTTTPYNMAFNADMSMLAVMEPGQIWVWSVNQGHLLFHLQGHTGQITSAAFSPDGKILATGGEDSTILLWNLETGQQVGSPLRGHTGPIIQLAFNPRRNQLASSSSYDNTLRFWDVQTQRVVGQVSNDYFKTLGLLAYSPDGQYLATTTWHPTTEQPFASPYSITLLFSQADTSDVFVTLRDYKIDALRDLACQVVQHNLTIDQFNAFSPGIYQVCQHFPVDSSVVRSEIEQAANAAAEGKVREALDHYIQSTTWVTQPENRDPELDNFLCLHGSVRLFAREVLAACDHAVMLSETAGDYRDSRGIARALVGDDTGAMQDFQAFIQWAQTYGFDAQVIQERQNWIRMLQLKQNPFTPKVLANVWSEYRLYHDTGF